MRDDFWTTRAVAIGVFVLLAGLVLVLCFVEVPKGNHDIVIALTGSVTSAALAIVSFYFGSSSSSRDKDATIKTMATGTGTGGAP